MNKEEIIKMFRRIELDKTNDSCGFEFADGFGCTFDNIAICYDDRLKLYELTKQLEKENKELKDRIDKAVEYIEKDTRWFDSEYASIYGTLCTCAGAKDNRLEVMVNPSNLLKILKGDKEC